MDLMLPLEGQEIETVRKLHILIYFQNLEYGVQNGNMGLAEISDTLQNFLEKN